MAESADRIRRGYLGAASSSRLTGALTASSTSATGLDLSSWAGISTNGPYTVIFDLGLPSEEHCEATGISGNTVTGLTRGLRGTTAQAHLIGGTINHGSWDRDFDEANELVSWMGSGRQVFDVSSAEYGAALDGTTNDQAAIIAAVADAAAVDGVVLIRPTLAGCKITDTILLDGLTNIMVLGANTLIVNAASNATWGPNAFSVHDCTNVVIKGFRIDAGASAVARKALKISGLIYNAVFEDLDIIDHGFDFPITYGDTSVDPLVANFDGITFRNIRITGDALPRTAVPPSNLTSAGIDIFPRAQSGSSPVAKNLTMEHIYIDVTNGSSVGTDQGEQCLKVNNIDGVFLSDIILRGGASSCLPVTNGCRNVHVDRIFTALSSRGISLTDVHNVATTDTERVFISNWRHRLEGGVTGGEGIACSIGQVPNVRITNFDVSGDIVFIHDTDASAVVEDVEIASGTMFGGNIDNQDPGSAKAAISGLQLHDLTIIGNGANTGIITLNESNWPIAGARIHDITMREHSGDAVRIGTGATDNTIENIISIDGNPDNVADAAVVLNQGTRTSIRGLTIIGTHHVDYFVQTAANLEADIQGPFTGTPETAIGIDISSNVLAGLGGDIIVASATLDLSGAATDKCVLAAMQDYYILAIHHIYTEASTADTPGAAIRVGKVGGTTTYFSTRGSQLSKAVGFTEQFANNGGVVLANRLLAAGEGLTIGTAGGKVGAGEVTVTVSLVKAQLP